MRLWFAKVQRGSKVGLVPADELSDQKIRKIAHGECVQVELTRPRSVQWNRMYFAMCREIGENQDPKRDENSIDHEIRVRAGHKDVIFVKECEDVFREIWVPKRIAFDKLTADEWEALWPSFVQAISETFGEEYILELGP